MVMVKSIAVFRRLIQQFRNYLKFIFLLCKMLKLFLILNLLIVPTLSYRRLLQPCVNQPVCLSGILSSNKHTCCSKSCGVCGGDGCSQRNGGYYKCCETAITNMNRSCNMHSAPCSMSTTNYTANNINYRSIFDQINNISINSINKITPEFQTDETGDQMRVEKLLIYIINLFRTYKNPNACILGIWRNWILKTFTRTYVNTYAYTTYNGNRLCNEDLQQYDTYDNVNIYDSEPVQSDIINNDIIIHHMDVHDGISENILINLLQNNNYTGLLLLTNIHLNNEMNTMWNNIKQNKIDISYKTHWIGIGIVLFI